MTLDRRDRPEVLRSAFRGVGWVLFSLLTLIGLLVLAASLYWVVDLNSRPIEPPGQIVAIVPIAGLVIGTLTGAAGVGGLAAMILWRRTTRQAVGPHDRS